MRYVAVSLYRKKKVFLLYIFVKEEEKKIFLIFHLSLVDFSLVLFCFFFLIFKRLLIYVAIK